MPVMTKEQLKILADLMSHTVMVANDPESYPCYRRTYELAERSLCEESFPEATNG